MQVVRPLHQSLHKKKDQAWQRDVKMQETPYQVIMGGGGAAALAVEKGASSWLSVIPRKDMDYTLYKMELRDVIHLRYEWQINDIPSVYVQCWSCYEMHTRGLYYPMV